MTTSATLSFSHGVHPEYFKHLTDAKPIEQMPFAETYVLPLGQHTGAPSKALVRKGQEVRRGQMIAEPGGFVSVALHAPVDGTVTGIELVEMPNGKMGPAILLRTDPYSTQQLNLTPPTPPEEMDLKTFLGSIQSSGLVGLGGAAFPAHVKFSIPEGKTCRYLMLNGAECEPFLTSDHRTMVEHPDAIVDGTAILQHFIRAEKIFIGIEDNKPDAIAILTEKFNRSGLPAEVVPLKVKYPQGAEKMLITSIIQREVPSGKLPLDVETLVSNISSIAAMSYWFRQGIPLIERVVTISGEGVTRPGNYLIPVWTPLNFILEHVGLESHAGQVIFGGPMMGAGVAWMETPTTKGVTGIVVLRRRASQDAERPIWPCIRCSSCVQACPIHLNPSRLGLLARKGRHEEMKEEMHLFDCFECGCCSYVCPSGIPLVQQFRMAKQMLREAAQAAPR